MTLKQFAKQHNLFVRNNLIYGCWGGYGVTMIDRNNGFFCVSISTNFPVPGTKESLERYLQGVNLKEQYKITEASVQEDRVSFLFRAGSAAVLTRVEAFLTWFAPVLTQYAAAFYNRCSVCGQEIPADQGQWVLEEDIVRCQHPNCTHQLMDKAASEAAMKKQADDGSYLDGAVGALIAAVLGAVVWGFVLKMGFFVGWIGLLIGLAVNKGYELLHGKMGKGKAGILTVSVVLSVILGTFLAYIFAGNSPRDILYALEVSADIRRAIVGNIVVGLLFSGLGIWFVIAKAHKDVSGKTILVLSNQTNNN